MHLCADVQTARFVCTTDDEMNQIASFYAGAMARSREIDLEPIAGAYGGLDLVVIAADDPEGMVKHSAHAATWATGSPPTRPSSWPGWTDAWCRLITGARCC